MAAETKGFFVVGNKHVYFCCNFFWHINVGAYECRFTFQASVKWTAFGRCAASVLCTQELPVGEW